MIKFRYVFKNKSTGELIYEFYNIKQIERLNFISRFLKNNEFELISRDRYIGMLDINGKEIYENDIDQYGFTVSYVGGGENDHSNDGLEVGWYLQVGGFASYSKITFYSDHTNPNNNIIVTTNKHKISE